MNFPPSAVEPFLFRGKTFYVKRDDLIHQLLSGNKYRKLFALLQTPSETYDEVVSYGGAQSNAMLSIAAVCHQKGWAFDYTSKSLPEHIREHPTGNLKLALELGMRLHEVSHEEYDDYIDLLGKAPERTAIIPQGGADHIAREGVEVLAAEIVSWQREKGMEKLTVVTPSGTGTTAYYMALALKDATVVTTAGVGDGEYLRKQLSKLGPLSENLRILSSQKKYHFGKPYREFLEIYRELKTAGIEFDLIYAAKMWLTLMEQIEQYEGTILYVHSGGIIGNETMLRRYAYKGMI